ncbi:MAG: copper-binding protein [Ramlibacter sp.]|nr:copper-binding protein [Ramlibacter sp.]
MRQLVPALLIALASTLAVAQTAKDMADAEVRKIDKDNGKLTLRHGPIKNLDMPGMTMVFRVKDPALLDSLAVGDKIRFHAEQERGAITVTEVEKVAR